MTDIIKEVIEDHADQEFYAWAKTEINNASKFSQSKLFKYKI